MAKRENPLEPLPDSGDKGPQAGKLWGPNALSGVTFIATLAIIKILGGGALVGAIAGAVVGGAAYGLAWVWRGGGKSGES